MVFLPGLSSFSKQGKGASAGYAWGAGAPGAQAIEGQARPLTPAPGKFPRIFMSLFSQLDGGESWEKSWMFPLGIHPPTRCVSLTSRHLSGQLLNSLICHMRPPRGSWRPHFVLGTQQWLLKSFPYFKSKVASPSHLALERTTHPFPSEVALFPSSGTLILLWGHLPPFLTQDPKVMNFWIPMSWFFKCWWIQLTWSKSESAFGFKIKRFDYRACFCALFL